LRVSDLAKNEGEARGRLNPNGGDGGESRQLGGNYSDPRFRSHNPAGVLPH